MLYFSCGIANNKQGLVETPPLLLRHIISVEIYWLQASCSSQHYLFMLIELQLPLKVIVLQTRHI